MGSNPSARTNQSWAVNQGGPWHRLEAGRHREVSASAAALPSMDADATAREAALKTAGTGNRVGIDTSGIRQ